MTSSVLHMFLHIKAHCVNSLSTSIKIIIINVLKNCEARSDQSNRRIVWNIFVCLLDLILYVPDNNISVMSERVFLV